MANRRMISKKIIDTDAFMDMPLSTQALYMHLVLNADDDGFVGSPKKVMRSIGCMGDDLKILLSKRFLLDFESGVIVIKHWKIHNLIRIDRYTQTTYIKEKNLIEEKTNKSYTYKEPNKALETNVIPNDNQMAPQVSKGKVSKGKVSIVEEEIKKPSRSKRFIKPTIDEIKEYCKERNNNIDAENFYDYYESKGWVVGKSKMKDWKASIRTWERNGYSKPKDKEERYEPDWTQEILDTLPD